MFFPRKKKGMIDIRELARRGKVRKETDDLPDFNINKDGFVDMGHPSNKSENNISHNNSALRNPTSPNNTDSSGDFIDFVNIGNSNNSPTSSDDQYTKREVDNKIQKLDTIIYKLEQRIELLERKAGVNSSVNSSDVGVMGW